MKRLMRNANLRFGFGKATSATATTKAVGDKESMAITEFISTSTHYSLDRLSPFEGTTGASAAAVNRRGCGVRAIALASSIALVVVAIAIALTASSAQAAAPSWKLLAVTGPTNIPKSPTSPNEAQGVTLTGFGTFTLTFNGQTTPALNKNLTTPAQLQTALNNLLSINAGGGSVTVTGAPRNFVVTFDGGPLKGTDVPLLVGNSGVAVVNVFSPTASLVVYAVNKGGAPTTGSYSVTATLPSGLYVTGTPTSGAGGPASPWTCPTVNGDPSVSSASCTRSLPVQPGSFATTLSIPIAASVGATGPQSVQVEISGGGAPTETFSMIVDVSDEIPPPGVSLAWAGAFDEDGAPETRAGAHPATGIAAFFFNTKRETTGKVNPVGATKDVVVDLPAGFAVNPMAVPRCPRAEWFCGGGAWIGAAGYELNDFGQGFNRSAIANVLPPKGSPAQLTFQTLQTRANTTGKLRPDDFGIRSLAESITTDFRFFGTIVTLWGEPGNPVFNGQRCRETISPTDTCTTPQSSDVTTALLTNPTECAGQAISTVFSVNTWLHPAVMSSPVASDSPPITGCDLVPFTPTVSSAPDSSAPDSATGLRFDTTIPQLGLLDPDAIAQSHLRDVTVELPEGVSVNPSGATGLAGCSDAQIEIGTDTAPACPDGAKIGTVEISSPLIDRDITGTMYFGTPKSTDPTSGQMLRLFLVARDDDLGVMVKLLGSATANPATGKLTATFKNNPRLPFDSLKVRLKGGDRGVLATPQSCGAKAISATLVPWSGTAPVTQSTTTDYTGNCAFGFVPKVKAGMSNSQARGTGTYSFTLSREDGEQWVNRLTAKLPVGLLASVKDIPLCTDAHANAGACPQASQIGTVDATAGSGTPFVLEEKGQAFLTEGYKDCAYGLMVSVPVIAGPFDGKTPETDLGDINVRQSVCVDPVTAQVTVASDEFPTIWKGIPLRVRSITVNVDRAGFMLNPSDCSAKQTQATFFSPGGGQASASSPFYASDCAGLAFKPRLALQLIGKRQITTGTHPRVKAVVTQAGKAEAGIQKAVVRLPKSLALDPDNAQALCEFDAGTRPDLENHCPEGSIVGRARATTPLLRNDLVGNVYFVKNVRKDPKTGNTIRTLPMIVVALRGEIAINLKGQSSTTRAGKLVNTFASVPDAPISQFNMNIKGGKNGILAVTRTRKSKINLCARPKGHVAEVDMDGHNGRRHDFNVRMKTPCQA